MNTEGKKRTLVKIENEEIIAERHSANNFMESFEGNSNPHIPRGHREMIHEQLKNEICEEKQHGLMSLALSIIQILPQNLIVSLIQKLFGQKIFRIKC